MGLLGRGRLLLGLGARLRAGHSPIPLRLGRGRSRVCAPPLSVCAPLRNARQHGAKLPDQVVTPTHGLIQIQVDPVHPTRVDGPDHDQRPVLEPDAELVLARIPWRPSNPLPGGEERRAFPSLPSWRVKVRLRRCDLNDRSREVAGPHLEELLEDLVAPEVKPAPADPRTARLPVCSQRLFQCTPALDDTSLSYPAAPTRRARRQSRLAETRRWECQSCRASMR